jgi:hypothetical protein
MIISHLSIVREILTLFRITEYCAENVAIKLENILPQQELPHPGGSTVQYSGMRLTHGGVWIDPLAPGAGSGQGGVQTCVGRQEPIKQVFSVLVWLV